MGFSNWTSSQVSNVYLFYIPLKECLSSRFRFRGTSRWYEWTISLDISVVYSTRSEFIWSTDHYMLCWETQNNRSSFNQKTFVCDKMSAFKGRVVYVCIKHCSEGFLRSNALTRIVLKLLTLLNSFLCLCSGQEYMVKFWSNGLWLYTNAKKSVVLLGLPCKGQVSRRWVVKQLVKNLKFCFFT